MAITTRLFDTRTNRGCLTTSQAGKYSDLSSVYLAQLLRKGTIEGFKIDREWFIYADSLEQFLAKNRKPGPRGPRKPSDALHEAKGFNTDITKYSLYSLASPNAQRLMQLAGIERFAVDDCILLMNSNDFRGWEPREIKTTILGSPLPIPDDLAEVQKEKLPAIQQHYFNGPHYRLVSVAPAFSELDHLKIALAPVSFYDYYSLNAFFDEPLLTSPDGSKTSIRQKYGNTALIYSSTDRETSLIPAPISIQCIIVTQDKQIILMQRSHSVAFYPNHWSASFEKTMNASTGPKGGHAQKGDENFFTGAIWGLDEEFAVPAQAVRDIKALSLNVEYLTFSVDVIIVIELEMSADEVKQSWMLRARHREEASKFALLSTELSAVVDRLFMRTLWHPSSRMRLIQLLFHMYGIDEVARAIKTKRDALP